MSANPEFAERLSKAQDFYDRAKPVEDAIPEMANMIALDTCKNNGRDRYKSHTTIAALLAYTASLRALIPDSDLTTFDRIVAEARTTLLANQKIKPNGDKIIKSILRVSPVEY